MVLPVSTMSSTMTMLAPYNFLMSWIPWMPTEPEGRVSIFMKSNATWIEVWDRVELNLFTLSGSKKVYHLKTSFSGRLKKQLTKELKVSPGQVSLGRTCILLWRLEKADSEDLWQPGPKMNKGWGNWIHCDKLLLVLVRCKGSEPVQKSWIFFTDDQIRKTYFLSHRLNPCKWPERDLLDFTFNCKMVSIFNVIQTWSKYEKSLARLLQNDPDLDIGQLGVSWERFSCFFQMHKLYPSSCPNFNFPTR